MDSGDKVNAPASARSGICSGPSQPGSDEAISLCHNRCS